MERACQTSHTLQSGCISLYTLEVLEPYQLLVPLGEMHHSPVITIYQALYPLNIMSL